MKTKTYPKGRSTGRITLKDIPRGVKANHPWIKDVLSEIGEDTVFSIDEVLTFESSAVRIVFYENIGDGEFSISSIREKDPLAVIFKK